MVAVSGDPRTSNELIQTIFAAGLSATKGNVDQAADAGLKFFAELEQDRAISCRSRGGAAPLAQGTTPIIVRWDYLALGDRDTLKGNPDVDIVVPKTGIVAGVYVQAISAYAPHPNAAKLWMEHLYSDEVQLAWLKGYCHPIRFEDLVKNKKVPDELLAKLPPAENYEKALFPTLEQQGKAKEIDHQAMGRRGRGRGEVAKAAARGILPREAGEGDRVAVEAARREREGRRGECVPPASCHKPWVLAASAPVTLFRQRIGNSGAPAPSNSRHKGLYAASRRAQNGPLLTRGGAVR